MTDGMHIDEASMKNLSINFKVFQKEVLAASVKGLAAFGMRIVAQAKRILKADGHVASGLLRNSGRTVVQPDNTVDAGFYAAYAYWVEYGRNKGGMPPVDDIYQWLRRKRIMPDGDGDLETRRRSMAWAIAKDIASHGSKPKPFLKPAYEQHRLQLAQYMQARIREVCDKYKKK